MSDVHAPYDPFAWFYDRHWGHAYHRAIEPILDALVLAHLPPGARVLDVCCGAGHGLEHLVRRGFTPIGVDLSPEMVACARRRVPSAEVIVGDARRIALDLDAAAALSLFESLNHVLETRELEDVFRGVHRALAPGGCFFFDLNRDEAFACDWSGEHAIIEPDAACFTRASWDPAAKLARCELTTFRPEHPGAARWVRAETTLHQRAHEVAEVRGLLERAGFGAITTLDAREALDLPEHLATARTFFLARRGAGLH